MEIENMTEDIYSIYETQIHGRSLERFEIEKLQAMNKTYCHVQIGGKHAIAVRRYHAVDGSRLSFEPIREFRNLFLDQQKILKLNKGSAWLQWSGKHQKLGGVTFQPDPNQCPDDVLNLFQGFAIQRKGGEVEPFLRHVYDVICNGDTVAGDWLIQWFAHLIQRPEEKPSVAVLLKSVEGTGKNSLVKPFAQILGSHCVQLNGADQIINRFNGTVANRLMCFADEVKMNSETSANKLKALISEPSVCMELKFMNPDPVPNLARFMFASNNEHVIRAGTRERRYLVLEVSDKMVANQGYFNDFYQWLNNHGAAHLLDYLYRVDIAGFNPHQAPRTRGLINEKLESMNPVRQWFYEWLCNPPTPARICGRELAAVFREWMREMMHTDITQRSAETSLGYVMKSMKIEKTKSRDGVRQYQLPAHRELCDQFSQSMDCTFAEVFD